MYIYYLFCIFYVYKRDKNMFFTCRGLNFFIRVYIYIFIYMYIYVYNIRTPTPKLFGEMVGMINAHFNFMGGMISGVRRAARASALLASPDFGVTFKPDDTSSL